MSRKPNETIAERESTELSSDASRHQAYFLSLEIENCRTFRLSETLNLSIKGGEPARWTVILGDNGVGKTTLLQTLAGMQPGKRLPASNVEQITLPALFLGRYENFGLSVSERGRKMNAKPSVTMRALIKNSLDNDGGTYFSCKVSLSHQRAISVHPNNNLSQWNNSVKTMICYGYGATRRTGKSNLSDKRDDDTCASLFFDDAELLNAEEWLLQTDYAASKTGPQQQQAQKQLERIKEILVRLLPDVEEIRISLGDDNSGRINTPIVQANTPYGWVSLDSLSLGYRALITWMVDLASRLFDRYPKSADPLAEPAIVLVDEIDLHLHPRWQRTLMRFLSDIFRNTQFIVTAHSPLIVQSADADTNIVLLRREGDHVIIDNDVETIKNWRVDQILTSDLFGLETARPPELDTRMAERKTLLAKARLTKRDQARLAELEREIGDLPTGETPEDIEAMDIIRRAAALLK